MELVMEDGPGLDELLENNEASGAFQAAFRKLDEPCRTLLLLFYWEQRPMEEIATRLGFANAQTAKAKKYQCKDRLRSLITEQSHD